MNWPRSWGMRWGTWNCATACRPREKILKLFSSLKELGASPADGAHGVLREQVGQLVDEVFEKLFTSIRNGYGVEIESQADWRSLQLSAALGYDTRALYDVLERFKSVKGTYGGAGYRELHQDLLKDSGGLFC